MLTRIFVGFLFAFALASPAVAAPAAAPSQDAVLAPFRAFIDAYNKGDTKAAAAQYAPDAVIVDEVAPFEWRGKAFAGWSAALDADWKAKGFANGHMALGAPSRFAATKDRAYAILPAHLTATIKGKPGSEDGFLTVTLSHAKTGWLISSWTFTAKH